MPRLRRFLLLPLLIVGLLTSARVMAGAADDAAFARLADEYFDALYLPSNPTAATEFGIHRYDDELEDYTAAGARRQAAQLHTFLARLERVDVTALGSGTRADYELLRAHIRSSLLTLEELRPLQTDPDAYSSGITASAFAIMLREYAPAEQRLRHLVARETAMPAALLAARSNLRNPPRIHTQIAIRQLPGIIDFFRTDLPQAFATATDAALNARFAASNARVVRALEEYQHWLESELLPRSNGDFRLGAQLFARKLQLDEFVVTPLDELLAQGVADLRRNQAEFGRVAARVWPGATAQQALALLAKEHPARDGLFAEFRENIANLERFVRERDLMTLPAAPAPILRETPPFLRATTSASMIPPGPFETRSRETFFNLTLPDPGWDAARADEFLSQFSHPVIVTTVAHETYPGHHVQQVRMAQSANRLRQFLNAGGYVEGWAHYCEELVIEQGYTGGVAYTARGADMLRLGMLQDALLRDARFVVAIRLHTQGLSLDEATRYFVEEGYQTRDVAESETRRGTGDPMYLQYTLGKLQIRALREEVRARDGDAFSLKRFHDRFLELGQGPVPLVRRQMLGLPWDK